MIIFPIFVVLLLFDILIFVALSLLFAEDYSVKEWTDAVKYIVDETAVFSSAKEAYAFLRKSLAEKIEPVSRQEDPHAVC